MMIPPDIAHALIALLIAGCVLAFLRVTGFAFYNAVIWHNLKIEVHQMRISQQKKLYEMAVVELDDRPDHQEEGPSAPAAEPSQAGLAQAA